jgi:hypothetical protein
MQNYYDQLLEYWETGNLEDAIRYFEQWKMAGLLSQEEIENLNEILSGWSQGVRQEALTRLLVEKGKYTEEEFLEMVKVVDREIRAKVRWKNKKELWIKA